MICQFEHTVNWKCLKTCKQGIDSREGLLYNDHSHKMTGVIHETEHKEGTDMYEQQRKQARELIMDTAVGLFRQKGYDSVTVEDITKTVGVAKGTFYNFFKSKRELLMAWSTVRFADMDIQSICSASGTAEEGISRLVDEVVKHISLDAALFSSFLRELGLVDRAASSGAFDFKQVLTVVLRSSEDFAGIGERGLEIKVHALNSLFFAEMLDWVQSGREMEGLAGHLKAVLHVCINGIFEKEV